MKVFQRFLLDLLKGHGMILSPQMLSRVKMLGPFLFIDLKT